MTHPTCLASAAFAVLLALSAAAEAQSTQSPAAAATPPPSPGTTSPMAAHPVPGATAQQRVETYIRQMHAEMQITPAEQPQWDRYAAVMRENARDIDTELAQRIQQFPTMNALQNLQSYEKLAEAHARRLEKLVPAFADLYNAMPEQQKQLIDRMFRENAMTNARGRGESGSNATR